MRLRVPSIDKMIVEVETWDMNIWAVAGNWCSFLVLICGKIKQTMQGVGRVSIQSHHGSYIWIFDPASIHRLVSFARAREDFKCFG